MRVFLYYMLSLSLSYMLSHVLWFLAWDLLLSYMLYHVLWFLAWDLILAVVHTSLSSTENCVDHA